MIILIYKKCNFFKRLTASLMVITFLVSLAIPVSYANTKSILNLPAPGAMILPSINSLVSR